MTLSCFNKVQPWTTKLSNCHVIEGKHTEFYSYIFILSKNTTYIYQQIDNILEFWQHVSAVKKPSSGQKSTMSRYTRVNKNPSAWNFLSPKLEVTCGTVAIIIRVVFLSPYLRIRAVSLSSIHYNQSHRVYINRRRQYICLIWN